MKEFISNKKRALHLIINAGVSLSAFILTLLIPPPVDSFADINFIRTIIIFLMAFLLIPMFIYNRRKHLKNWIISAIITFISFVIIAFLYLTAKDNYILNYADTSIVIGTNFTSESVQKISLLSKEEDEDLGDGTKYHNEKLLNYVGGNAEKIWTSKSIQRNKLRLVILFYSCIVTLIYAIASTIQSIEIVFLRRRVPRHKTSLKSQFTNASNLP